MGIHDDTKMQGIHDDTKMQGIHDDAKMQGIHDDTKMQEYTMTPIWSCRLATRGATAS